MLHCLIKIVEAPDGKHQVSKVQVIQSMQHLLHHHGKTLQRENAQNFLDACLSCGVLLVSLGLNHEAAEIAREQISLIASSTLHPQSKVGFFLRACHWIYSIDDCKYHRKLDVSSLCPEAETAYMVRSLPHAASAAATAAAAVFFFWVCFPTSIRMLL